MSASPSSLSQLVPHEAARSGAETSRQGGEHCQRTVRRRHWWMLLCLSCLSAVFLVLLVLAVGYALGPESLAQQSLTAARRCGDIPTWGESNLKACKHREESGDEKSVDRYFACQRPCYPLRPSKQQ
ncbi:uncharacterized protein LOC142567932 isoform X2 [Dermacentor variabilis]|uniref:uncharacterized protein LOC142567932 isoform X2 n=1 Tax=Dermacentor variabilis TaxID=34621 RepID=UPI003F5BB6A6